jgi:anti-anti-sigma regulatory factor
MAPTPFNCAFDEDTRVLTVAGALDVAAALTLRRELIERTADRADRVGPWEVTMDLSLVDDLSDAAVGVIAAARAEMRAHHQVLTFIAAQGTAARSALPHSGMSVRDV